MAETIDEGKVLVSEESLEAMAGNISAISEAMQVISESRLKPSTLIVLLHHATRLRQRDIKAVLDALESLERDYLKPKKRGK